MSTPRGFTDRLRATGQLGPEQSWVLAKRSARLVEYYGAGTLFLSQRRYGELVEQHRTLLRDDQLFELAVAHDLPPAAAPALIAAFEAGRRA